MSEPLETPGEGVKTTTEQPANEISTIEQLEAKIDSDPEFRKEFLAGNIIPFDNQPREADALPAEKPEETLTPAGGNDEGMAGLQVAEPESVFTLKKEDLVIKDESGKVLKQFKTPAEMMKSLANQEKAIRQQREQLNTMNSIIRENNRIVEELRAKGEKPAAAQEVVEELVVPEDPFDPEYLSKLGKAVSEIPKLRAQLDGFINKEKEREIEKSQEFAVNSVYTELQEFQEAHPDLKTNTHIQQIDVQFSNFLNELGKVAKTDGSIEKNLEAFTMYANGTGEKAEELRALMESSEVALPEEYSAYNAALYARRTHEELKKLFPNQTIQQTISILEDRGIIPKAEPAEPAPLTAEPKKPEPSQEQKIRAAAERRVREHAANVPAGVGGASGGVDEMSAEEEERILDTTYSNAELRSNPALLARVNAVMVKYGQKPLDLYPRGD